MDSPFENLVVTDDFEHVLGSEDIDAVIICTPPLAQVDLVASALRAGKHVIVEKPVGLDPDQIYEIISLAHKRRCVVLVPFHLYFNPLVQMIGSLVRDGRLGSLAHIYHRMFVARERRGGWIDQQSESGGVIFETLVHGFQLLSWLLGPPVSVSAMGIRVSSGLIPAATVTLRWDSGAIATVEGSWFCDATTPFGSLDVVGTSGSASFDRGLFDRRFYALRAQWLETDAGVVDERIQDEDVGFRGLLKEFVEATSRNIAPDFGGLKCAYQAATVAAHALEAFEAQKEIPITFASEVGFPEPIQRAQGVRTWL